LPRIFQNCVAHEQTKFTFIIIVLSSISAHFSTQAQNHIVHRFTIRKSFQTKDDWAKPAVITFTKPQEKSASWLLDMAIGYSAYHHPKGTVSVIPYMELHRNTLIDKPQSVWIGVWQPNGE
jgi:hypothetical protein